MALNPETPVSAAREYAGRVEFLLVMSVYPGWGGQKFIPEVLAKFAEARALLGPDVRLGIDGGVNLETAREAVRAGCECLIAGTWLFKSHDFAGRCAALRRLGEETR